MFEDYNGNNKMTNIPKTAKTGGSHHSGFFLPNENACRLVLL